MIWLWEKPGLIVILGLLTAALLGGIWIQTGRKSVVYGLVAALTLTGFLVLLEHFVQTDREQVETTLHRIARDVERNDLDAVLEHIHPDAKSIRAQAEAEFPQYVFHTVDVKQNLTVTVRPEESPPKAVAEFNVVVTFAERSGVFDSGRVPRFVRVTFVKEGTAWRVADYEHSDPGRGFRRRRQT